MSTAAKALRLTILGLAVILTNSKSAAQDLPPSPQPANIGLSAPSELQLEVYVNGASSGLIATFRRESSGALLIEPVQLRNVGIVPAEEARRKDGWIDISRLPNVSFEYDEQGQIMRFSATDGARAAKMIDAGAKPQEPGEGDTLQTATSGAGALLNYTLYGATGGDDWRRAADFQGLSSLLEARAFSPFGILSSSQILSTNKSEAFDTTRLDSSWSYSDERRMVTYSAGDIISGGLSWTRPVRLGGIQIQRNFSLRPDMVTMPLPEFSGSAAVPSTVDVYVNNARRLSQDVPAGPFAISNLPVVTGQGTAQVVVRDSLGRETVSETPFFASSDLLAKGLWDYSGELGFARRSYGTLSFDYDDSLIGSATARYGLSDSLTLEGHAEAGADFYNIGAGGVFSLGSFGVGSFSGANSRFGDESGYQVAASVEGDLFGIHLYARTQRAFGDYQDIASITTDERSAKLPKGSLSARPPKALDQIAISAPLKFDATTLNLSFTQIETFDSQKSRIVGLTANRSIGDRANVFVTAYKDLSRQDSFGIFAGLSWSFGDDKSAAIGMSSSDQGAAITADLSKSERQEIGSYGWRLRGGMGQNDIRSASGSYRSTIGRFEAGAEQYNNNVRTYGQLEGSIVAAGGDVFVGGRIDDAFGVVDAGAPDVDVLLENRPVGKTNRRGKILLPGLHSYGENNISIDPTNLPIDARVDRTKQMVKPSDRAGAVVDFKVQTGLKPALITLRNEAGAYVEAGSSATSSGGETAVVGYDGQIYLDNAGTAQKLQVTMPSGLLCEADIAQMAAGENGMRQGEATCRAGQ